MEPDEMKILWQKKSLEIEKQKILTDSMIIKMTNPDFRNKFSKIWISEVLGAFACLTGDLYIFINFQKLSTWYLQVCGVASVFILFLLPILSLKALYRIRSLNISTNTYKQSLLEYSRSKLQMVFVQKLSFYMGAVLMVTVIPVMGKLIRGTDLFKSASLWYWYVIVFPFFYYFANWVFKSYRKTISEVENLLKELNV